MRFVVSHKAVPANGIAVVIDVINERTENRRSIRPQILDDSDHFDDVNISSEYEV
jgi:hypothetical protein